MLNYRWANEEKTGVCYDENGTTVFIDDPDFLALATSGGLGDIGSPRVISYYDGFIITRADVNAERNRRMRGTFTFNGTIYNCDTDSLQRITGTGTLAGFAIAAGKQAGDLLWHGGAEPFVWIAADNSIVTMDAQTAFAFGQAAAANETLHIFAAKALKDMDPIPDDYAADEYWPD